MKTRLDRTGLVLFAFYLVIYASFVVIAAWWPEAMDATPIEGINVAILYGFGLIAIAFVLALFYGTLATPDDDATNDTRQAEQL